MKAIYLILGSLLLFSTENFAQEYRKIHGDTLTQIKITSGYYIENSFLQKSPEFLYTRGGYIVTRNSKKIALEFNSQFPLDSLRTISFPDLSAFTAVPSNPQVLDGAWLMGGRVRDGKTSMRDTSGPRKTLKLLFNGTFQWVAFNTAGMKFMGTGGGTYSAVKNQYNEEIAFFSRDSSRVGAILTFNYSLIEGAWHHKGLSSKGQPIHEIWIQRPPQALASLLK